MIGLGLRNKFGKMGRNAFKNHEFDVILPSEED